MEAHTAFIADSRVELHARDFLPGTSLLSTSHTTRNRITPRPGSTKRSSKRHVAVTGVLFKKRTQGGHDFIDGLRELGLMRVALLYMVEETIPEKCLIHRYKNLLSILMWLYLRFFIRICICSFRLYHQQCDLQARKK